MILNGHAITTIPDTGAQINAISKQAIKSIGVRGMCQWGGDDDKVGLGNGMTGEADCQVEVPCRFPDGIENTILTFHVFSELAEGVLAIMGQKFLDDTQCLTVNLSRLRERQSLPIPRCLSIGPILPSGLLFKVYLDGKLNKGLADTGSEIDLISEDCAKLNGFQILGFGRADRRYVQVATGGDPVSLTGKVIVRFDTFEDVDPPQSSHAQTGFPPPTRHSSDQVESGRISPFPSTTDSAEGLLEHDHTFYVLPRLPYDLVFSQALLHAIDAFNLHKSAFEWTLLPEGQAASLCPYFWWKGNKYPAATTSQYILSWCYQSPC
jgi:hypothetical protein